MPAAYQSVADYVYGVQRRIGATAAALYILEKDRLVHESYFGRHDAEEQSRPVDAHSQYNVASIRKTYLALAVSILIQKGKIGSIDDPLSLYLDNQPEATHGVTLRHLLTHTHGLMESEGRLLREFAPGQDWVYRNTGIGLLFRIVTQLSGQSLNEFMTETVFEPYGLRETGWRTAPHEYLIYNYYSQPDNWVGPNDSAAGDQGNLFVSARDLARWGQIHLRLGAAMDGSQVLPREVFERVTALQTPASVPNREPRNGYIWWLQHDTPLNQIGEHVPRGSYQALGLTGCAVLVIPAYDVVAVRMYNQLYNPGDFDYLADIRTFGNLLCAVQVNGGIVSSQNNRSAK